jgi:D-amino-acid oxidase
LKNKHILILGAGVSGLSSGILLLKDGYDVSIWAKNFPPGTTSDKAGAFWYPYLCDPQEKVTRWAKATLNYFKASGILDDPMSGCVTRTMTELIDKPKGEPWWKDAVESYQRPSPKELSRGYVDGYQIDAPLIDTSIYMGYLLEMYKRLGGILVKNEVHNIHEAFEANPVVVNCSGLGSRDLFNDKRLYPVRGQNVRIKSNGFDRIIFDDEGPNRVAIIVPRIHDTVLGTTVQANDWNTDIDPKDTKDILRRCANLDPAFEHVEIIGETVGLRPYRDEIRLEAEGIGGKTVVHNYGHGGSGFTLSWGCALDVLELVKLSSK